VEVRRHRPGGDCPTALAAHPARRGTHSRAPRSPGSTDGPSGKRCRARAARGTCTPMTSWRQFQANRLNALKSTGPRTEEGKRTSRRNALRHGLTAETVIDGLGRPPSDQPWVHPFFRVAVGHANKKTVKYCSRWNSWVGPPSRGWSRHPQFGDQKARPLGGVQVVGGGRYRLSNAGSPVLDMGVSVHRQFRLYQGGFGSRCTAPKRLVPRSCELRRNVRTSDAGHLGAIRTTCLRKLVSTSQTATAKHRSAHDSALPDFISQAVFNRTQPSRLRVNTPLVCH
jgi:hypothetical protein